ncbi:ABC transporter permease subunit [Lactiplantibacillus sp. WILCCON 0030]|uniref:ABC transporter permease subunit n=1 Tax=Lactiplantibacillus brownii TaxID=3069269 RepID=A0ABU1A5I6_9LACO|nr:ABC transporter permease subunit [Lactiplantibacillus brownii]MDQ7936244.1 ABC transporter permease subunit [Lactiplantibacillus brownii]
MINLGRVKTLVKKDLLGIKNDKVTLLPLCLLPLVFSLILPTILLLGGEKSTVINDIGGVSSFMTNLNTTIIPHNIPSEYVEIYAILMYFFIPIFALIPVMLATVIASSSFVGEKENKTIEGLLYTPLTNSELVLGKILAAAIPAMLATWVSILIYGILLDTLGLNVFKTMIFPNVTWILVALFLDPCIVFLAIALVIFVAQRVKTSKAAQSVAMILILPIIVGVISQASGAVLLGIRAVLIVTVLLLLIDLFIFVVVVKRFNREKYILKI